MNSLMTIQIRVLSAQARRELARTEGQVRSMEQATRRANAASTQMSYGLPALSKWGNQVQWAGRQLQYNFTLPLLLAAGAAVKFQLDNEKAMVRITKVYGDAEHGAQELSKEVDALAESFEALSNKFGVQQAAVLQIAGDWAAAGASGIALARAVNLTLETMVLGEMEASEATEALISIQSQYGQNTKQLAKTIDVLNMVENETGITMQGLIQGFSRAAGVARSAGVDVEHLGAMLAALVPASGSALNAGNALKTVISRLLAPTKEAAQVLGLMGIEMDDINWKSLNAAQRLELMADKYQALGQGVERNSRALDSNGKATGRLISSQQAIVSSVVASRWQINRWDVLMRDIAREQGYYQKSLRATADQTANYNQRVSELNAVLESNPQRLKQMWVIIQNAMTDVIQPMIPYIVWLAQEVAKMAQAFADMNPLLQKSILIGLAFLAIIGPLGRYIGSTATLFGVLSAAVHWFTARLGLSRVAMIGANGEIVNQRRGLLGLIKSWLGFMLLPFTKTFSLIVGGLKGVAAAISMMPAIIARTIAVTKAMFYTMLGVQQAVRLGILGAVFILSNGMGLMASVANKSGLANIFASMWQTILGIFKTGQSAALATQLALESGSVASTQASTKARIAAVIAGAKARLGIETETAEEVLAITAGASKAMVVNEEAASARRAAARAAWTQYLVTLARSYNAAIYGIEAGASATRLALEAKTGTALVGMDQAVAARRAQVNTAWIAFLRALLLDFYTQARALQAGASASMLALEASAAAKSSALRTAWIAEDLSARAAWVRYLVTLAQAYNAAVYGIEARGAASRLALESSFQASRVRIASAGETAMVAVQAAGSRAMLTAGAATATAQVGIFSRMWAALVALNARWGKRFAKVGILLAAAGPVIAKALMFALTNPYILATAAALGVLYAFRDDIARAWNSVIEYFQNNSTAILNALQPLRDGFDQLVNSLNKAFWALPAGVRDALLAVVNIVRAAALEVYSWFSWMNPWQRHSPSLVESVQTGMAAVRAAYASAGNVGGIFKKAANDLKAFKQIANSLGQGEWAPERKEVKKAAPGALPTFDALRDDLRELNKVLNAQGRRVSAQEGVVERWTQKLDKANAAVDRQRNKLERLQGKLQNLQDAYSAHEQALQDFASAPIKGMGKMEDAIFANEMAQKKLRLEMLKFEQANGSIDDMRDRLATLMGDIETMRGRAKDLREAGAGSEILGPIEDQIRGMEAQARALQKGADSAPLEKMQDELDKLQQKGEILDLQKSIKFDPMLREINKLANAQKELTFNQIINGINNERAAMEALQPKIDAATAAVTRQQQALDSTEATRNRIQATYDKEAKQLDRMNERYRETESLVRDIEAALRDMGNAASETNRIRDAKKAEKDARKKKGGPKDEYLSPGAQNFLDAKGGGFPDPGMDAKIGREGGWKDQSKLIDEFTNSIASDVASSFGSLDVFAPLKKWWNRTWDWLKSNVGPVVKPLGGLLRGAFDGLGNVWDDLKAGFSGKGGDSWFAGVGEAARTAFDKTVGVLKTAWGWGKRIARLFGPDVRRVFDALKDAAIDLWNKVGPELAEFKDLFGLFGAAIMNVGSIALPILVGAFKFVTSVLSTVLGPVFDVIIDVLANVIQAIRGLTKFMLGILAGDLGAALDGLKDLFGGTFGAIGRIIQGAFKIVWGLIKGIINFVKDVWNWFFWLYDELVGHSIIPDMIDGIINAFESLWSVVKWLWKNVLKPIYDLFVDLWDLVVDAVKLWWKGITKIWKGLFALGKWFWENILKPVWNWVKDLWSEYVQPELAAWWDRFKRGLNNLLKLGKWVWNNILKPVWNWVKDLWSDYVKPALGLWWEGFKATWSNLKQLATWVWNNILKPVFNRIKGLWSDHVRPALAEWWGRIKGTWDNLKGLAKWVWNNVLKPVKDKFAEAWRDIRDWFTKNGGMIVKPIAKVINVVIKVINTMIDGLNAIAKALPGISWHIGGISPIDVKQLAAGGDIPSRQVGNGFKTQGARAIVGEGRRSYPEYVIPTDPQYRSRAQSLLQQAGNKVGMLGIPMHADGGILGAVKDIAGKPGDWIKGGLDWVKGNIEKLASTIFKPFDNLVNKGIDQIDWDLGRQVARSAYSSVKDVVTATDKVMSDGLGKVGGGAPGGPPIQGGDWQRVTWRGHQFNARTVRMIQMAEKILGQAFHITQGSYSTSVAASGSTHAGGGVFDSTYPNTIAAQSALRSAGFAAWIRTPSQGPWPTHIHSVALGDITASDSAKAQMQSYLNGGIGLKLGGIVKARYGGTRATLGEGSQDEAVIPLPRNWRTDIIGTGKSGGDGDTIIEINGNLEFPNINTGEDAKVFIANLKSLAGGGAA